MMVVMNVEATKEQIDAVITRVEANKYKVIVNPGEERTVIAVVGINPVRHPRTIDVHARC